MLVWHSSREEQGRQLTQNTAAVHWCMVTANLFAVSIFIGVNAVAQGCCQLVWHSSTEEQGRQLTLNTAAVHWCMVTANLYAEWNFIGKDGGAQGCCQLLWHGSTEEQGRQLTLNTAAVHWCMVTASLYAGLAQQQRRTRQAVNPKHCSSALVYGDCTPFQGRQLTLNTAAVHLFLVSAHLFAVSIFIGVNAVAQDCCQLVWHSSTEEQGRQSTQNIAAVYGDCTSVCRVELHR